ncbi:hypothetical protein B0H17DRAFT_1180789 [Mycena rosella]|uniref:Uncharacterized protein n=1 Tax=Mycena rosella TaxID=1033263 RepID=A0AAD7DBW4_MYCRO|nr:hypothetical protein B0H17DRAFT_1180789 [Mycena rosella]
MFKIQLRDCQGEISVRSPVVPQLFGVTESRGVNALIYHDELITVAQFRQLHSKSLLISAFIEYQMYYSTESKVPGSWLISPLQYEYRQVVCASTIWVFDLGLRSDGWPLWAISSDLIPWEMSFSITPGTRDIEQQLFARMDVCDIHAILMTFPSLRNVKLSVHHHIPFGKLATAGGDLLDFQVHFPDSELSKVGLRVGLWRAYGAPLELILPPWTRDGHATGVKLNDLRLIRMVDLSMRLRYPEQNMDPPSKLPYLFVFGTAARIEEDGSGLAGYSTPRSTIFIDRSCYP